MTSRHASSEEHRSEMATTPRDGQQIENPPGLSDFTATDTAANASERAATYQNEDVPNFLAHQQQPLAMEASIPEFPLDYSYSDVPVNNGAYTEIEDISSRITYSEAMGHQSGLGVEQHYVDPLQYLNMADETRIHAYAKLDFPDGPFYMNTYSAVLGRDVRAAHDAMEEEKRRLEMGNSRDPHTPVGTKQESRYKKSVVSESGGILREGNDSDGVHSRRRKIKASRNSKSSASSSQKILSRRNSLVQSNGKIDQSQPQARRYAPDSSAVPVNPASLRPSPHYVPLIGLHPPADAPASTHQSMSRRHVKIAYNLKKNLFEAHILGRNGCFVDEVFYHRQEIVPLRSGANLQIGGVVVRFTLPDVAFGETGAEELYTSSPPRHAQGGKEMSFEFEGSPPEELLDTSVEQSVEVEDVEGGEEDNDDEEDEEDEDAVDQSDNEEEEEDEEDQEEEEVDVAPKTIPEKRRGPGRPPKDGIMSKREQMLAKKAAEQKAQSAAPQQLVTKNKVGRPRKHPRPDTPPVKTEKRKYTKRKPKDPNAIGDATKEKKEKKEKRPRSPTPTFEKDALTPEQLAKPTSNYVTLIHEALLAKGEMSLPQIYRQIQRAYPYYVCSVTTTGWQSSVRHNLQSHPAFTKIRRDGKGWVWDIVEGASIEKEKKRRPTPPFHQSQSQHHQPIYQAGPHPQMMHGPHMMGPPPGYVPNGPLPQHLPYTVPHPNSYQVPPGHYVNGQAPQGYPQPPPQPRAPQGTSYSSPYAPTPNLPAQATQNMPDERRLPLSAPPQTQQARPPPAGPSQSNDRISHAIEVFKATLIDSLKGKSDNAEEVVASAVNRVLGLKNTLPIDPQELTIMEIFRTMISQIPGANSLAQPSQTSTPSGPSPQTQPLQPPSQPSANSSVSSKTSAPAVQRPSFIGQGQNRPSTTPSIPRPQMMTPSISPTVPATAALPRPTISAAAAATSNTANSTTVNGNLPRPSINDNGKRQLESSDDMAGRDFKRLSSGPPPLKA